MPTAPTTQYLLYFRENHFSSQQLARPRAKINDVSTLQNVFTTLGYRSLCELAGAGLSAEQDVTCGVDWPHRHGLVFHNIFRFTTGIHEATSIENDIVRSDLEPGC